MAILNCIAACWRIADRYCGTGDPKRLSVSPRHGDRAFGPVAGSTGEFRKIQLVGHTGRRKDWHAMFVEEANVESLISTGC